MDPIKIEFSDEAAAPPPPVTSGKPPAWRVRVARNVHFTGRENVLVDLRRRLTQGDELSRVQALSGAGGIGKTQLAAEYAHRFKDSYGIVWWLHADDAAGPEVGLADLARALHLSERSDASAEDLRRVLFRHLAKRDDWLLIFDDAPDAKALAGLIPPERTGHVIITSRNPNWLEVGRSFPLACFDRNESIIFLLRRTNRGEKPDAADKLANALGDMPLALDQAAALIEQTRISFADYLARFELHWAELLRAGKPSTEYPLSVAMSWELSFRQVEQGHPYAAQLLAICSFLSPDEIPRRLFRAAAPYAPQGLAAVLGEPLLCAEAVGQLVNFSLVDADEHNMRIHPLAAGLARDRLSEYERETWATVAARTIDFVFSFDSASLRSWDELSDLLPHALAAAAHADALNVARDAVRSIYNEAGHYLLELARYDQARQLLERAMQIALELWGPQSARVAPIANNLGRVLLRCGDPAGAREYFEQALKLDEKVYGLSHPHYAEVMNNRGVCLHSLGDAASAEADFKRALEIYQFNYGPEHAKIASMQNNIGYSMSGRGDFVSARAQLTAALQMAEGTLGVDHPTVAAVLRNLGNTCRWLGQPRQAKTCFERALAIDEKVLGPDHPDTGADISGLGEAFEDLGELEPAKRQLLRAVAIEESRTRPDVSRLADRYAMLTRLHRNLGETEDARRCSACAAEFKQADSSPSTALSTS